MIVSYIFVGILSGPSFLGIVQTPESVQQLAQLSIAVLLFLVGMKLDLQKIKTLGPVSLMTGLGQVLFTAIFGFIIVKFFGFDAVSSLYISVGLTFSSTIIIVKLLSDKREVDTLHGRIAIGFLIVQDLLVVFLMVALSAFGSDVQGYATYTQIAEKIIYAIFYILTIGLILTLFVRYLATPLLNSIIQSPELLITFAISLAAVFAAFSSYLGFSKELGGLLAGISLASTPFRESIISRLSSLRDFLLLFFFISLGSQVDVGQLGTQVYPAVVLSLFVLVGNPIIVMIIMGYLGYRKRTGLLAGLTVAQISEFSLIFIAMGITLGHITADSLGLVTVVGLITIATSIYMITYSHIIYNWLEPVLWIFERKVAFRENLFNQEQITSNTYDVVIFGLGRYGIALGTYLKEENFRILGVDYDPDAVQNWSNSGMDATYGDAWDLEVIAKLPLKKTRWVISAIPLRNYWVEQEDPRQALIDSLSEVKYQGRIAVAAQHPEDVAVLHSKGAELVFLPFYDAAERAVERIKEFESKQSITS